MSESTDLAEKCKEAGILFIGPSASCISAVGDKVSARQVAKEAGVPIVPGTEESITSPDQAIAFANQYGYPVMLKARDGGGGRGIRMVHDQSQVAESLARCINESPSKQVFIEKAVTNAKHIEVQILGDSHGNVIHLFERDCSAQRRYQKVLEVRRILIPMGKFQVQGVFNKSIRLLLALVSPRNFAHLFTKQLSNWQVIFVTIQPEL